MLGEMKAIEIEMYLINVRVNYDVPWYLCYHDYFQDKLYCFNSQAIKMYLYILYLENSTKPFDTSWNMKSILFLFFLNAECGLFM